MIDADGVGADVVAPLVVALHARAGQVLAHDVARDGLARQHGAEEARAEHQGLDIARVGEEVGLDRGLGEGVGRGESHRAGRVGPVQRRQPGDRGPVEDLRPVGGEVVARRREHVLHVGARLARIAAAEAEDLGDGRGRRAGARQQPLCTVEEGAQ